MHPTSQRRTCRVRRACPAGAGALLFCTPPYCCTAVLLSSLRVCRSKREGRRCKQGQASRRCGSLPCDPPPLPRLACRRHRGGCAGAGGGRPDCQQHHRHASGAHWGASAGQGGAARWQLACGQGPGKPAGARSVRTGTAPRQRPAQPSRGAPDDPHPPACRTLAHSLLSRLRAPICLVTAAGWRVVWAAAV